MSEKGETTRSERWRRSPELLEDAYSAWKKSDGSLNPSSVVATIDADGTPRVAPFGSMRAVNPQLLRFIAHRYHDTLANLKRDPRISVAMICAPDIAVSVRGQARIVEEPFSLDENYALVEIDIDEVKNDMPIKIGIESGITISPSGPFVTWWNSLWSKMGGD
ncbi:pyridoxamine 5'-phosphate oxidase family protein [Candidatus Thorarchaeota archaeon]|nr:MAG: pyridoxamine 5'-phosphate oxidase family protein [Candidatus Thorarchaeota archaeon]